MIKHLSYLLFKTSANINASILGFILLFFAQTTMAQYAPAAGQPGTTAIPADSSIFVTWANYCTLERGWINIADTTLGKTSLGLATAATGIANNGVVSLGDGGTATLLFPQPIRNGSGFDFAVFENGFASPLGDFLELAFVEVSSDGINFVRFPNSSLTSSEQQVNSFGTIDPKQIHNLAGKYYTLYGTPFDLENLINHPELDLDYITHVRIVDVVGSITTAWANYDNDNLPINDPYPTAFPSGGFDLDAVGVIHQNDVLSTFSPHHNRTNSLSQTRGKDIIHYPNPVTDFLHIDFGESWNEAVHNYQQQWTYTIHNSLGTVVQKKDFSLTRPLHLGLTHLAQGVYYLSILDNYNSAIESFLFFKN
ncbi:MAG: T9SS type A sorting domain-containing protein [Chitinophagales bacterium]